MKGSKRSLDHMNTLGLDPCQPREQAMLNSLADSYSAEHFKKLLIHWVVNDNIAFRKVESESFHALLTYLNPRVQVPCAEQLRRWITDEYKSRKDGIIRQLHQSQGQIHLSFDLWTSKNLLAFNGVVAHFITTQGVYKTLLLALPEQDEAHVGENIAEAVAAVVEDFQISNRLGYFVLDNAGNNDTCMAELGRRYSFDPVPRRLRCMGHVINLVARSLLFGKDPDLVEHELNRAQKQSPMEQLEAWRRHGPIGKLHNWVVAVHNCSALRRKFNLYQREVYGDDEGWQSPLALVRDNSTRWNSTLDMIERAIKLRGALDELMQSQQLVVQRHEGDEFTKNLVKDYITTEDWNTLAQYVQLLEPMKLATKDLEGHASVERPGPIGEVLIDFEYLMDKLEVAKERLYHDDYFRWSIELAWQKANKYYSLLDDSPVYVAAVVLNPRRKWKWIEERWAERKTWIADARAAVNRLWQQYNTLPESEVVQERPVERELNSLAAFKKECDVSKDVNKQDEYAFWTEHVSVDGDYKCPIAYWLAHKTKWPKLTRMALDIFSIPAMSDEPERIFSLAGCMVTDRRKRLKADAVQAGQCLRNWNQAGF